MEHRLRVLVADTTDPYFNLATEDWIFNDMSVTDRVLFLWRNDPCIIVGRGQNVWSECLLDRVEEDGVHVVRRHSGGGAVYQDLGNTCFTFMRAKQPDRSTKELYSENNAVLLNALHSVGVEATASGRNDLVVEREGRPFKISGSAFKESRDRCFHHGTMLMNVDLGRLSGYLTPDSNKLQAKGIKSVRARVMNLGEIAPSLDHGIFCRALIESFFRHHGESCEVERLDRESLTRIPTLSDYYEKLKSWAWVYGKTPNFQHTAKGRFSWGGCELHLDTTAGLITEAVFYTDSLDPEVFDRLPVFLTAKPYSKGGVSRARLDHQAECPDRKEMLDEFYQWVENQI